MINIVTAIFRPILCDLQPNLGTPVYHHKVFLMMQEMVFMFVVGISIDWLFCNLSVSVFCSPQFPSSVLCNRQRRAFAPCRDPVHVRPLIISHCAPTAQSPTLRASRVAGERVLRRNLIIEVPEGTSALRSKRMEQPVKPVVKCSHLLAKVITVKSTDS
jgi:hypothetical protein